MENPDRESDCSSKLIEFLESDPLSIDENDPFYWYFHLKALGKWAQTKDMVDKAVTCFNVGNPAYTILRYIAKKHLTREVCDIAVSKNGLNLKYVPEQYRDASMCLTAVKNNGAALSEVPNQILIGNQGYEICLAAVQNDYDGQALSFVPDCHTRGKKGKALCEAAVQANGHALEYVPKRLITNELARLAIEVPIPTRTMLLPDGSRITASAYEYRPVLSLVPKKCMSEELVNLSARLHPRSLRCAPPDLISRELCYEMLERDPMNIQYIPTADKKLAEMAVKEDPRAILAVPESLMTIELCRDALRNNPSIPIEKLPEMLRKQLEKEIRWEALIKYKPIALETPSITDGEKQVVSSSSKSHAYDLSVADSSVETIYYISDIHLEHQLVKQSDDIMKLSLSEIQERIDDKIAELLESMPDTRSTLLIGGDVADSIELEDVFYERLNLFNERHEGWRGRIFTVLGNHELWDGDPMGRKPARPIDEIVADYRQMMNQHEVRLLENELFVNYKGLYDKTLNENAILNASVEELAEVCANSTFLLLGGIGFSGLNPIYNAKLGLYGAAVSTEEEIVRSKRFRAVYEKVLASARDIPVIVLTHTQMADWSDAQYNSKWIYVSGHTHQNTYLLQHDGTAVFSDNQIGYKPQPWHLNNFTIDMRTYDPLKDYQNGIHQITREQYVEFNRGQGITMQSMKHPGDLFALKHNGIYMFMLKSASSLCLLEGGRRHKLDHDISYYYEKLPEYVSKVRSAFMPYQQALLMVSHEVKMIGGSGRIHGCIVDIDWFNHIYLNPFDGKLTPYFALNTTEKWTFENIESLLDFSPIPPQLSSGESMLTHYREISSRGKQIPLLSRKSSEIMKQAIVPQVVLDRSMYEPSRIMRSIQYIFEQSVVRIWNDDVLTICEKEGSRMLPHANELPS